MGRGAAVAFSVCLLFPFSRAFPYSVLTHEAIIDATWDRHIVPLLQARFPDAGPQQLKLAHAYAYGGCIIQDMGYYPFGSRFFSDLVHYVRSADFAERLIRDSANVNEYAFALGALAHYVSDSTGHPTINRVMPMLYPRVRARYGAVATYEDNPIAHVKTEFGFDVLEVARGTYAPQAYHDFVGFEVAQALLERAFAETYGIELKKIFFSTDLVLGTYRFAVSQLIPETTKVAWDLRKDDIQKLQPGVTEQRFRYTFSRAAYERDWGQSYRRPGWFARFLAFLLRLLPRFGPFRAVDFHAPTAQTETMFVAALNETRERYALELRQSRDSGLRLPDLNLDIGQPTVPGAYRLADKTYAKLLHKLAEHNLNGVDPELRRNILAFYDDAGRQGVRVSRGTKKDVAALRASARLASTGKTDLKTGIDTPAAPAP